MSQPTSLPGAPNFVSGCLLDTVPFHLSSAHLHQPGSTMPALTRPCALSPSPASRLLISLFKYIWVHPTSPSSTVMAQPAIPPHLPVFWAVLSLPTPSPSHPRSDSCCPLLAASRRSPAFSWAPPPVLGSALAPHSPRASVPSSPCPGPALAWPHGLCGALTAQPAQVSVPSVASSALVPSCLPAYLSSQTERRMGHLSSVHSRPSSSVGESMPVSPAWRSEINEDLEDRPGAGGWEDSSLHQALAAGGGQGSLHLHPSSPHHLFCGASVPEENVLSCYCRTLRRKGLDSLLLTSGRA